MISQCLLSNQAEDRNITKITNRRNNTVCSPTKGRSDRNEPKEYEGAIAELENFIAQHSDSRETRKAYAVKLIYQGYLYDEIQSILGVSRGSITGWKKAYCSHGIEGLRLNYKGRKSYLSLQEPEEILSWLQSKDCWELGELEYKLAFEYGVVYLSKQSYYGLFTASGISWKKTTKLNPKADPEAVAKKKRDSNFVKTAQI